MDPITLITAFYESFSKRDGGAMAAAYGPNATFSDPVFTDLKGPEVGAMWQMLCERGKDLRIEFRDVRAEGDGVRAHWEAWYSFSVTGRPVHNIIEAQFTFKDGLILSHRDEFDFWAWSQQALGPTGLFLGWTPIVRNKVRGQARKGLDIFMQKRA